MNFKKLVTIDFETEAIELRPDYPPKPVGVAIKYRGRKGRYYAWGHPTKNNCTYEQGMAALQEAWEYAEFLLFQNGKFDYDVATEHCDCAAKPWSVIHDTLFLLFLRNPYARTFSLKPSAEEILGLKPEEQDAVKEWILSNVSGANGTNWGAFICLAPGDLVGTYAIGDVDRTESLFDKVYQEICDRGMLPAYDRERRLMPILLENETEGIDTDLPAMERDYPQFVRAISAADDWLRTRLGVPDLNLDADKDVADALGNAGIVTEWNYTKPTKRFPNGQRSVSKKNLTLTMFNDPQVASAFGYRNRLITCLSMFMESWLRMARSHGGKINTNWNQVRQSKGQGKDFAGAKTGRLSSSPPFMNIPKDFENKFDGYAHPTFLDVPHLPLMRKYLLPEAYNTKKKKMVWGHRDYSQQELRILAHFEDGELMAHYLADPSFDVHGVVQNGLQEELMREFIRDFVKRFVFQKIYGGGIPAICEALQCDVITANRVVKAMMKILPGYAMIEKEVRDRGKNGLSILTWGGREYFAEPPSFSQKYKRQMTYEYKLLNYLIQGSAADCTKEALIRYHDHPKREARFLVTVHDEINCAMPQKRLKEEMTILRECMQSVEFDVPMLSEAKVGPNWGTLEKRKDL